jgi:hypothetical protein
MTKATEPGGRRARPTWLLGLGATALVLGLLLPWIEVPLPVGSRSYSVLDLRVLPWVATLWTVAVIGAVVLARVSPSPVLAIAAAVITVTSAASATVATVVVWRLPSWVPTDVLPPDVRPFAPSLGSGPGPLCVAVGCGLLAAWALRRAAIQVELRRLLGSSWVTGETHPQVMGPDSLAGPALTGIDPPGDDDMWGPAPW